MDWEQMRAQLEAILEAPFTIEDMQDEVWRRLAEEQLEERGIEAVRSVAQGSRIAFVLSAAAGRMQVLVSAGRELTTAERRLIELTIETRRSADKKPAPAGASDEEKRVGALGEWLLEQCEHGVQEADLPDAFVSQMSLYSTKIPLLLYGDYSQTRKVQYRELKKLLETFFDGDIILIPLQDKEWLILGAEALLLGAAEEREDGDEESVEETLSAIVSGLHAMLESEWVGECHLAVDLPMKPSQAMLSSLYRLRETMMLGRLFHVTSNIHLPWKLRLEKLLHLLPDRDKAKYLGQVLKGADHLLDAETQTTLEQFFALDCNVSETAKKLYVHRNTLLYRLDKFKQETGLDVRSFSDAVLVRIALLLYKVTKRK
ncbi:PucR family transcriptional regulator [Paenibacillus chartarius]|uniref:PucR family transcriptional regulator n=1 Tax=Paenibacillus chartarius TaxID=747481 RepID=A0ABV6DGW4_9BACL